MLNRLRSSRAEVNNGLKAAILLCVLCIPGFHPAWAESPSELTYSFNFSPPVISKVDGYDRVTMEGCERWHKAGAPLLPFKGVAVLIPQGKKVAHVTYETGEEVQLPG